MGTTILRVGHPPSVTSAQTSVIIVTYNHADYIEKCLQSVAEESPLEIIVFDNNSSDDSVQRMSKIAGPIRIIESDTNQGFGRGNNVAAEEALGEFLVFLNPDATACSGSLNGLTKPLKEKHGLICVPKILLSSEEGVDTIGGIEHFTGLSFTQKSVPLSDHESEMSGIKGFSGACFSIRRDDFLGLGGFDERFFCYMEDTELSWRARVFEFEFRYAPDSIILHDHKPDVTPGKLMNLEKGRYMILRKYLTWREIIAYLPSFLTTEVLTWGFAASRGGDAIKGKLWAFKEAWQEDDRRTTSDRRALLRSLDWKIPDSVIPGSRFENVAIGAANAIYRLEHSRMSK